MRMLLKLSSVSLCSILLATGLIGKQAIAIEPFEVQLTQCQTGMLKPSSKQTINASEFKQRAQFSKLGSRTAAYYFISKSDAIYSLSYLDGRPLGCRRIGSLNVVENSCNPGYPGVCRGKRYIKNNRLNSLGCTSSGPVSEANPACTLIIEGVRR